MTPSALPRVSKPGVGAAVKPSARGVPKADSARYERKQGYLSIGRPKLERGSKVGAGAAVRPSPKGATRASRGKGKEVGRSK